MTDRCVTCGSRRTDGRRFCKPACYLLHPDGRPLRAPGVLEVAREDLAGNVYFVP